MENQQVKQDGTVSNHPFKKLAEKIAKDFSLESQRNTRLGVSIDWSKGTMILQSNK